MGRAYRSNDMDDSDNMGMDTPEDDVVLDTVVVEQAVELTPRRDREDDPETRSVTSRCRIRDQLNHDVEAYLASGGAIHHAADHLQRDTPQGSGGHYGSRSL